MLRVAVDAMGGDHAPGEIVKGAFMAVEKSPELEILLVGAEEAIRRSVKQDFDSSRIRIMHTDEVIGNDEDPGLAIRRKKKASMVAAMQLVRNGQADAVVSAGNTGALMAGGLLFLGRIPGIKRPALLTVIPTFQGGGIVVLDVGANMDAKADHMIQYALMGDIYASQVLGKKNPRVGLLNVGSEENKGNHQVKAAYNLLGEQLNNFVGNVEAKEFFQNKADVLVCDGFVGNVLLKTIEGVSRDIFAFLKEEIKKDIKARLASTLLLSAFKRVRTSLDDSEHGGALLIGVKGVCIKCHGSSQGKAISQAILRQAMLTVNNRTNEKIAETFRLSKLKG